MRLQLVLGISIGAVLGGCGRVDLTRVGGVRGVDNSGALSPLPIAPAPSSAAPTVRSLQYDIEISSPINYLEAGNPQMVAFIQAQALAADGSTIPDCQEHFSANGEPVFPDFTLNGGGCPGTYDNVIARPTPQADDATTMVYGTGSGGGTTLQLHCPQGFVMSGTADFTAGFQVGWAGGAVMPGVTLQFVSDSLGQVTVPVTYRAPGVLWVAPEPLGSSSRPAAGKYFAHLNWSAETRSSTEDGLPVAASLSCDSESASVQVAE